jgi:hypothetical protein
MRNRWSASSGVSTQDIGLPVKRFQYLDPLLMADGQILDQRIRIDVKFIIPRQIPEQLARLRQRRAQKRAILGT